MDEEVLRAILILAGVLIGLAILLKICARFYYVQLFFMAASSIGIIVTGFAAPDMSKQLNWDWIAMQAGFLFAFFIFFVAGVAFDKEQHRVREANRKDNGDYEVRTRIETSGGFFSTIGLCLVMVVVVLGINYAIFHNGIALGVLGCIAVAALLVLFLRYSGIWDKIFHRDDYYG